MTQPFLRPVAAAMIVIALVSVLLLVAAMHAYPGGTQWNPYATGNNFWENYLSDLARTVALNGEENALGSALAQSALGALALGLLPFWWLLSQLIPTRPRLGAAVRSLGYVAGTGALAVALLPADRFSAAHGIAIIAAGVPGLIAAPLAVLGLIVEGKRSCVAATIGAATWLIAVAAFVPYVMQFFVDGPGPVAAAVLERLALIFVLAWMGAVAWRALSPVKRTAERRA